jgi:hypothetical protein
VVTPQVLEGLPAAARQASICRDTAAGFAEAIVTQLLNPRSPEQQSTICRSVHSLGWETQLSPFLPILEKAAGVAARS